MIFSDDMKDISAATCSLPLSDLIARWRASTHPPAPTTIDRFTVTRVVTGCFGNSARLLFRVEVIPYGGASPYAVVSSPPTRRPSVTGWSMCKPATGEGMDKSTLVRTQIQIIIIHFLPYPILLILNG
jgi:hypothetical protein